MEQSIYELANSIIKQAEKLKGLVGDYEGVPELQLPVGASNWAEHNTDCWNQLSKRVRSLLLDGELGHFPSNTFVCVRCGHPITALNFQFYGNDVQKVECYNCQGKGL